jgi:hypothetical protein
MLATDTTTAKQVTWSLVRFQSDGAVDMCTMCEKVETFKSWKCSVFLAPTFGVGTLHRNRCPPLPLSLMSAVRNNRHVLGLNDVLRMSRATWVHLHPLDCGCTRQKHTHCMKELRNCYILFVFLAVGLQSICVVLCEPSCLRAPRARARAFTQAVATRAHRLLAPIAFAPAVTLRSVCVHLSLTAASTVCHGTASIEWRVAMHKAERVGGCDAVVAVVAVCSRAGQIVNCWSLLANVGHC